MKKPIFTFLLILAGSVGIYSQNIRDEDKRGFDEMTLIEIDVDGDGKLDTIQPRTFQTDLCRAKGEKTTSSIVQNWITFDLKTSKGIEIKSFFKYNYGTAEQGGSYLIYALIPDGDINDDGKMDLVFYAGDDTSDETVFLVNKGDGFEVIKRKVSNNDDW